jgi:hypothetical protein
LSAVHGDVPPNLRARLASPRQRKARQPLGLLGINLFAALEHAEELREAPLTRLGLFGCLQPEQDGDTIA